MFEDQTIEIFIDIYDITVPASGSIEVRAEALIKTIGTNLKGESVNLIG